MGDHRARASRRAGSSRSRRRATGLPVGVVGSGPAGLAAAAELNALGHSRRRLRARRGPRRPIRLGVPDFKLEKWIIDRRVALLEPAGIAFEYGVDVGADLGDDELNARHDAVVLALGSRMERDLDAAGPRARRHPLRDGRTCCSATAPSRAVAHAAAHGARQARDRDRRRRHGRRLRRVRSPRARRVGHPARHLPGDRGQEVPRAGHLAGLPEAAVVDLRARRGRRAPSAFNATEFLGDGHVRALRGDRVGDPPTSSRPASRSSCPPTWS